MAGAEIDKGPAAHIDPPAGDVAEGGLEGVIRRLTIVPQGRQLVVNAVLDTGSQPGLALYMRGGEVRGILEVGDHVRLMSGVIPAPDGTVQVTRLFNLTTSSPVSVSKPSLGDRISGAAGPALLSVIIGPAVGALVTFLVSGLLSGSHAARPGSGATTTSSHVVVIIVVAVVTAVLVAALTFRALYVKPRRARRAAMLAAAATDDRAGR